METGSALISSTAAAIVVICTSVLIERCGGRIGGILGTLPHVTVIGAIGLYYQLSTSDFRSAMLGMPIGTFCNAIWLTTLLCSSIWLPMKFKGRWRLTLVVLATYLVWGATLTLLLRILKLCERDYEAMALVIGIWLVQLFLGICLRRVNPGAPKGERKLRSWDILLRALLTFSAFMLAFWLASVEPSFGGAMVNAPFCFTFVLAGVWLAQSEKVAVGACGPMTLGLLSSSAFAQQGAWLVPELGLTSGLLVSWTTAVLFITLPQLLLDPNKKTPEKASTPTAVDNCPLVEPKAEMTSMTPRI